MVNVANSSLKKFKKFWARKRISFCHDIMRTAFDYGLILLGSCIIALTFNALLLPNHIAAGGLTGLSIILKDQFGWNPAIIQYACNIPLLILGIYFLGKQFGVRTLVGAISVPTFIYCTEQMELVTKNPLLAAIFGGIGVGLGLGLVFRGRGSTGGNAITAKLLSTFVKIRLSFAITICDGVIILLSGIILSFESAMYALITLFIVGKMVDIVQVGFGYTKVAFIISEQTVPLTEAILNDLKRGLTKLQGEGGYTGTGITVLMVVIGQNEVYKLKEIVRAIDAHAFVIISDANEVLGEGFNIAEKR